MRFEFNFYSSLLLVFFVHGIVYAILLFRKGWINQTRSDNWLAAFLLLCVLYIAPWMLGFGGWYDNQPYRDILFYTPFHHLFLIGPVIFFYVQSLLNPAFRFRKKDGWHLLPGLLYLLYSAAMVITDKLILKDYYFLADGTDRDFDQWYQATGMLSMISYLLLSCRYYFFYRKLMLQVVSYAELVVFRWVKNFLIAFLVMQLIHITYYLLSLVLPVITSYMGAWWNFFFFAIVFYYIAITGYANRVETRVSFRMNLLGHQPIRLLPDREDWQQEDDGNIEDAVIIDPDTPLSQGENNQLAEWKEKLSKLMEEQKAYENPELTLAGVCKMLGGNPSLISKMVNQGFGMNFNDFVNSYRINAVKAALEKDEHRRQTLLGIAFDAGFNSKATFNRAFKKATGQSPKDYIQSNKRPAAFA